MSPCWHKGIEGEITMLVRVFSVIAVLLQLVCPNRLLVGSATVDFVPQFSPFQQEANRLLVSITVADQRRSYFLQRQLSQYAHICNEGGFEVHVVLITRVSWKDSPLLNNVGLFRCDRLDRDLSIDYFQGAHPSHLAFYHRPIFQKLQNNYDFFINQEDDILINLQNVIYYIHYEKVLRGSGMVPAFGIYEIPNQFPTSDATLTKYAKSVDSYPRVWESGTYLLEQWGYVVRHEDLYVYIPIKSYAGCYMMTRDMLQKHSNVSAWLEDEDKDWFEYNTHFSNLWLMRYYHSVLPLTRHFSSAFLHHSTNKYINSMFTNDSLLGPIDVNDSVNNHRYGADIEAFSQLFLKSLGISSKDASLLPPKYRQAYLDGIAMKEWTLQVKYVSTNEPKVKVLGKHPIKNCAEKLKAAARINITFSGKYPDSFFERTANVLVEFRCVIRSRLPSQCGMFCVKDNKRCMEGFGSDVKPLRICEKI